MSKNFSLSKITNNLYIGSWPRKENLAVIKKHKFDLIIHMPWHPPIKGIAESGSKFLRFITIDSPVTPVSMNQINIAVAASAPVIKKGGRVLVYCRAGVHRSVLIASCILISQGMNYSKATKLIKRKRKVANPDTYYVKSHIQKFEREYGKKTKKTSS